MMNKEMQNENHTIVETLPKSRLAAAGCVLCLGLLLTGCGKAEPSEQIQNDNTNESIVQDDSSEQTEVDESDNSEENSKETQESEVDDLIEIPVYSTMEEASALDLPENMLAFYLVLTGKKPFVGAYEGGQEFYWNEYYWCLSQPDLERIFDFMIVDLDRDGEEEFVMTGWPETTYVLDHQEGKVYNYQFPFRGMKRILANGVYDGSSGASIDGYYRITFHKGTYKEETLAYMENDYFEVQGKQVSSEEFYEYVRTYEEMELVQSWDYTEEELERFLLEGLTKEELFIARHAPKEEMAEELPDVSKVPSECIEVLASGKEFVCVTEDHKKFYLDGNLLKSKSSDEERKIYYFSILDMDGDGIPEVVLTCFNKTLILRGTEKGVLGYLFDYYDEIGAISQDGKFTIGSQYYDGQDLGQYGRIRFFGKDDYEIEWSKAAGAVADRVRYYTFSEEMLEKVFAGE